MASTVVQVGDEAPGGALGGAGGGLPRDNSVARSAEAPDLRRRSPAMRSTIDPWNRSTSELLISGLLVAGHVPQPCSMVAAAGGEVFPALANPNKPDI